MNLNQKYKYGTIPVRILRAGANILYGHLLMCEIMMADLTQAYVMRLSRDLAEEGLAKHKVKQLINQMLAVTKDLKKRCDDHDGELVLGFTMDTWPLLVNQYYAEGGTVTQRLQWMFQKRNGNLMTMLYVACKDAADHNRIGHSVPVADCMMVLHMAQASIDLFDFIVRKIKGMLGDAMHIIKSTHNEKMRGYAREMLRILTDNYQVPEKDVLRIQSLNHKFYEELTSEALLTEIDNSISAMRNNYGCYVLANLAQQVRNRSLGFREVRYITARLGSFRNTRQFITELSSMQYDFSLDPMDAADELPISESATPLLHKYLTLCHDGENFETPQEDEQVVRHRELRQEARANNGLLPDGSLIQLYKELGTKKAVDDLLAAAGPELLSTRKRFRKLNVSQYKPKTKNERNGNLDAPTPRNSFAGAALSARSREVERNRAGGFSGIPTAGLYDHAPFAGQPV